MLIELEVNYKGLNNNGSTLLHLAAVTQDDALLEYLLNLQAIEINQQDKHGHTALSYAVKIGHPNKVSMILKNRAEHAAGMDVSLMHLAAESSNIEIYSMIATLFPNFDFSKKNSSGRNVIHYAAACGEPYILQRVLEAGGNEQVHYITYTKDPEEKKEPLQRAPLHGAAFSNNAEAIKLLLKAGADINIQDHEGNTPLYRAVFMGSNNAVAELLKSNAVKTELANNEGDTPLLLAVRRGNQELVRSLFKAGARLNYIEALSIATDKDDQSMSKLLAELEISQWEEIDLSSSKSGSHSTETAVLSAAITEAKQKQTSKASALMQSGLTKLKALKQRQLSNNELVAIWVGLGGVAATIGFFLPTKMNIGILPAAKLWQLQSLFAGVAVLAVSFIFITAVQLHRTHQANSHSVSEQAAQTFELEAEQTDRLLASARPQLPAFELSAREQHVQDGLDQSTMSPRARFC